MHAQLLPVGNSGVTDYRYRLLPVFAQLLPPDPGMASYIAAVRKPFAEKLVEKLAVTEGALYRRGNFNGSFDGLILEALLAEKNAEIAFSPGFRWGTTLLPGEAITLEHLMEQTSPTMCSTRSLSAAGRRHGARRRHDVCPRAGRKDGRSNLGYEKRRPVVSRYLRSQRIVARRRVNQPKLLGVKDNPGIS